MREEGEEAVWIDAVLTFWFGDLEPRQWFVKSDATDQIITQRFLHIHTHVSGQTNEALTRDADTALAAIIVLDQFPRNMFRGTPEAFASDAKALEIARIAVAAGYDRGLTVEQRVFMYLPYEHSELLADQDLSVTLMTALANDEYTRYAHAHRDVIRAFGRFPHRNAILGRTSTPEELAYLAKPGSGF